MNQRHHARQSSQGRKVPHARPSRPAPLTQRKSYNNAQGTQGHGHARTNSTGHAQPSPQKAVGPGWSTKAGADDISAKDDDEESGMASFLQFCTTCERQIVTPNSSILYCSEACRRRDSRPTSLQEIQSIQHSLHSPTPMSATSSCFDQRVPEIVPQLSPTVLRPMSRTLSDLSLGDSNDSSSSSDHHTGDAYRETEAPDYLQQFYASFNSSSKQQQQQQQQQHQQQHHYQRPGTNRTSTTSTSTRSGSESHTNLPSLSHSPSSSYGTVASNASYRPVMKSNPFSSTFATKSVELVIPDPTVSTSPTQLLKNASLKSSASTLTSFRVAEANDISYEARLRTATGSRRQSRERAHHTRKQSLSS